MFEKIKKSIQRKWLFWQLRAAKKLWQAKEPITWLIFCADKIVANPDISLNPLMRERKIYAPKSAKEMTEILALVIEAIDKDTRAGAIHELGPFHEQSPSAFLKTENGWIDDGSKHILFHAVAIKKIATFINEGPKEDLTYHRYNLRVLTPVLTDMQLYIDSIIVLYKQN